LSWSINLENDFAGYRVYRSDNPDVRGKLLTAEVLPAPAYRDMSVQQGHRYWYSVTAVDRAGNESGSTVVVADLTQLSQ
jgi:fibronectin type 3 domain-containing protein